MAEEIPVTGCAGWELAFPIEGTFCHLMDILYPKWVTQVLEKIGLFGMTSDGIFGRKVGCQKVDLMGQKWTVNRWT